MSANVKPMSKVEYQAMKAEHWAEAKDYHTRGVPSALPIANLFKTMVEDHRYHPTAHGIRSDCPACATRMPT